MTAMEQALKDLEKGLKVADDAMEYMPYTGRMEVELAAAEEALQVLRDLCYGNEALIEKLQAEQASADRRVKTAYEGGYEDGWGAGYNDACMPSS